MNTPEEGEKLWYNVLEEFRMVAIEDWKMGDARASGFIVADSVWKVIVEEIKQVDGLDADFEILYDGPAFRGIPIYKVSDTQ